MNVCNNQFNYKAKNLCLYVCMYVCPLHILRTVHPIYFTLDGHVVEDPKECNIECEVDRMNVF